MDLYYNFITPKQVKAGANSPAGEASVERVDWRELTPCLSDKLLDLAHLRG
ncbi:MAG: hypothetical protein ABIT23_07735 [Nitrosospira sp.]